jgi:hypothetical protein
LLHRREALVAAVDEQDGRREMCVEDTNSARLAPEFFADRAPYGISAATRPSPAATVDVGDPALPSLMLSTTVRSLAPAAPRT